MTKFDYLRSANTEYIEEIFERYQANPESIDESWRYLFEGMELGSTVTIEPSVTPVAASPAATIDWSSELKVFELIQNYRSRGKDAAQINPLADASLASPSGQLEPVLPVELELASVGLNHSHLEQTFQVGKKFFNSGTEQNSAGIKLKDLITRLKQIYCSTTAYEFDHIQDKAAREWFQNYVESKPAATQAPDAETQKWILERLSWAETFERFLHTRYVAQKRFSVEGGESVIPALDCLIEKAAENGAKEFVLGMAHRGRLNVLAHVMGKKHAHLFVEFEGTYKVNPDDGEGDVKYHKGYSREFTTRTGKQIHLALAANPSHLEFVNPVVEGIARAKQDRLGDTDGTLVCPVLIHGDAALAGQGVCYETLAMSQLKGYRTGGTIHIVVNNQVGFTTYPCDSRSTTYCTDIAKMSDSPVIHVNGDDPVAVWNASALAMEFRKRFKTDVFIDLVCYRKHGHNEGDEPSFTQPLLYKKIKTHPSTREIFAKRIIAAGLMSSPDEKALIETITAKLSEAQALARAENPQPTVSVFEGSWKGFKRGRLEDCFSPVKTAVAEKTLLEIGEKINAIPSSFHLHSKLARFFEGRLKAVKDGAGLDWGNAEALAFASLLSEGTSVRITGQDAERGTFTHRHSVLNDFETAEKYSPLMQVATGQAQYRVHNSLLSETAVLGFEHGYALSDPNTLTIWEAQFGDFANGAQVIIDQFISSSESKWQRMTGLTLLLPHGYEGQGPEHSSARIERFLALSGRGNWSICNLTTPANLFHALRRQVKRDFRKPLVIFTPKSLLRHPQAVSTLKDLSTGSFQEVITNLQEGVKPGQIKKVLLCSGKVYYDLLAERTALNRSDVALVRVEQLYPWPLEALKTLTHTYSGAKTWVWVQEEPKNMGPWLNVYGNWHGALSDAALPVNLRYAGRPIAASPAVGSPKVHESELRAFLEAAFSIE